MHVTRKLMALLVVVALVFGLVGTAFAAGNDKQQAAAEFLAGFELVKGVAPGDYALDQTLKRGELAAIAVRVLYGADTEKLAGLLKGSTRFSDIASHWASGYIALAANAGIVNGYPDGTFKPDAPVTYEQAAAMLLRLLDPEFKGEWPTAYVAAAQELGLLADVPSFKVGAPALRGDVFVMEAVAVFDVVDAGGKSLAQTYLDDVAPVVTASLDIEEKVTSKTSVVVSGSVDDAVAVYVNGQAVELKDKAFSAEVALEVGANTVEVVAVDAVGNEGVATFDVTRKAGEVAKVTLEVPAEVKAGAAVNVVAKAFDANGVEVKDAVIDIDGAGVLVKGADGYTAATKVGEGTVLASVGEVKAEAAVKVVAGELAKIEVSPATANIGTGTSQQFTAKGFDAYGNEVAVTPKWSAVGGVIDPASGLFAPIGSGAATVTATVDALKAEAKVTVFGAASKIVLETPASVVANGKDTTSLVAKVVDASGNLVPTYTGTVNFLSTDTAKATVIGSVQAVNGVATTTITAGTSQGTTVISASATGLTGATLSYANTAQVLTKIKVVADPSTLAADNTSYSVLKVTLLDQKGEKMLAVPTGDNIVVKFTSSDTTVLAFGTDTVTFTAGSTTTEQNSSNLTAKNKIGTVTVTGAVTSPSQFGSVPVDSSTVSTLIVGLPYKLVIDPITSVKAGTALSVTARILDVNGNQVTNHASISVSLKSGTTLVAGPTATTTGKVSFTVNQNIAGTYTYTAEASGLQAAPGVSATVTPAAAARIDLSASPSTIAANGAATSVLTAVVKDGYGNKVTDGSYAVKFTKSSNNGATATFADTTVNTVAGEASVTVTSTTKEATDTFTVTTTGLIGDAETVTTDIMGSAYKLAWGVYDATKVVGSDASVKVRVQDAANIDLTGDNGRAVTLTVKDAAGAVVTTLTANTVNGVATFAVNQTKVGTYSFEAASTGLVGLTSGASTAFTHGAAAALKVSSDLTTLAANGSQADITVTMVDAYGNAVTSGTTVLNDGSITVTPSVTTLGSLGTASNPDAWTYTIPFTTNSNTGDVTITATKTGLTSASVALKSIVVGSPASYVITAPADTQASSGGANKQELVVTIVDAAGNRITNYSGNVKLTTSTPGGTVSLYRWNGTVWVAYTADTDAPASKGQVKFGIGDTKAESLTYTIKDGSGVSPAINATGVTATGKFVAGTASGVKLLPIGSPAASPRYIKGDGSSLSTIQAAVVDSLNNVVTTAGGVMNFEITAGGTHAALLTAKADVINGVATAQILSKVATDAANISIKASLDVNANGTIDAAEQETAVVLTVDPLAPTISLTAASPSNAQPTIAVTKNDNVDGASVTSTVEYRSVTLNSGWATYVQGTTTLITGTYEFRGIATDRAGNSTTSSVITVDVDATAPAAVDTTKVTLTNNTSPTVDTAAGAAGAAEGSSTVKVYLWNDANSNSVVDAGETTLVATITAAADGSWTATGIGDNASGVKFVFTATDAVGNTSAYSAAVTLP